MNTRMTNRPFSQRIEAHPGCSSGVGAELALWGHSPRSTGSRAAAAAYTRARMADTPGSQPIELVFEDDEVRVWRVEVGPEQSVDASQAGAELDHWLCVLHGGRALVASSGGSAWEIQYNRGQSAFLRADGSEPRTIMNRGTEPLRFLRVELKEKAGPATSA